MTEPDWSTVTNDAHANKFPNSPRHGAWDQAEDKEEGPYAYPFRTCSYCGSIHPEDLFNFLTSGAKLFMADLKYGWPHKFYVDNIPNPKAGQPVVKGYTHKEGEHVPTMGVGPRYTHSKFYTEHLKDVRDEAAFEALVAFINKSTPRYGFGRDETGVWFRSKDATGGVKDASST